MAFAIYLNYSVGAHNCADGTACAVFIVGGGREETAFVRFFGYDDAAFWTDCHAQSAAFASFHINCYLASHF